MRTSTSAIACGVLFSLVLIAGAAPVDPVATAREAVGKNPEDVASWLALADALVAAGDHDAAETAVQDGITANPESAPLRLKLGDLYLAFGQRLAGAGSDALLTAATFHDASRAYGEARKLDPRSPEALYGMAIASWYLSGSDRKAREKARKLAGDCIVLAPRFAPAYGLRAAIFYSEKRFTEAAEAYGTKIALDGSDPNDGLRLGHCWYALGKKDKAKAAYIETLRRHPKNDTPIMSGLYHLGGKDWTKAIPVLREAAEAVPDSPVIHYYIGWGHFRARMWDDAAVEFWKAISLDPNQVVYANLLGQAEENRANVVGALEAYRVALGIDPGHLDTANRFDQIARSRPRHTQTEVLYEELCRLAPSNPWIHNNYGFWLRSWAERYGGGTATRPNPPALVKSRLERATVIYPIAAKFAPNSPQLQSDTGLTFEFYAHTRDHDVASRYFRRAIELAGDSLYRDAYNGLMRIAIRDEDWKALKILTERVVTGLEAGESAIAPMSGGPEELPAEFRARFLNKAKARLKMGNQKLAEKGE